MLTFYQFMMTYRGKRKPDSESKLADHIFYNLDFPKYSTDYDQVSEYLEWNSPFPNALILFDELWEIYQIKRD